MSKTKVVSDTTKTIIAVGLLTLVIIAAVAAAVEASDEKKK